MGILEKIKRLVSPPLAPHRASPQFKALLPHEAPEVLISLEAYRDTTYIIGASGSLEVGWIGGVQELGGNKYLIDRVFLFRQNVSMGHCEFDDDDLIAFSKELLLRDPANKALLTSMKFWGHLHPGDMTAASQQDDDQMRVLSNESYFIRGIFTRTGKAHFTFYDYRRRIEIDDCQWSFHIADNPARKEEIEKDMKEKVHTFAGFSYSPTIITHHAEMGQLWTSKEGYLRHAEQYRKRKY